MKRLLALLMLMLGLAATAAPAQARMAFGQAPNEVSASDARRDGPAGIADPAQEADPATSRTRRERALGRPTMRHVRTVYLPTVMLSVDRARE